MKFPVFSLKNREFGFSETGSLLTASHSPRLCHHVMSFAEKKAPQPAGEA